MTKKTTTLFVPGRLCLFGEHSDWAGLHRIINAGIVPGAAIVTGIEQGIYAEAEMTEHLGYEKNSNAGENSGNNRNGTFEPIIVPKHEKRRTK